MKCDDDDVALAFYLHNSLGQEFCSKNAIQLPGCCRRAPFQQPRAQSKEEALTRENGAAANLSALLAPPERQQKATHGVAARPFCRPIRLQLDRAGVKQVRQQAAGGAKVNSLREVNGVGHTRWKPSNSPVFSRPAAPPMALRARKILLMNLGASRGSQLAQV